MRSTPPHTDPGWEPLAIEPGTRVMFLGHPWDPAKIHVAIVGLVQDEDPYPSDARYPRRSPYITVAPENYYLGRMFFTAEWCAPYDGPAPRWCLWCKGLHCRDEAHRPEDDGLTRMQRTDMLRERYGVWTPRHYELAKHTERESA